MKLFEHPHFEQAIVRATENFRERRLRPVIIEKDHYVTEVLRNYHRHSKRQGHFQRVEPHKNIRTVQFHWT
jgi:hypothetical protein